MSNYAQAPIENPANHSTPSPSTTQPKPILPPPLTLQETCADIYTRVSNFLSEPCSPNTTLHRTQAQTRLAISIIDQALQDYTFNSLSLSYNGGKDCLVLLILYLSALHTHFTQPPSRRKPGGSFPVSIPSIYAKPPDPFNSVSEFVESSTRSYHLELTHISTAPKVHSLTNGTTTTTTTITTTTAPSTAKTVTFRDAFALYLETHPDVRAIFVGTRRTDPHGATLNHFQMTDGNWPSFMRIHPVIDWKLSEIWCFLRAEQMRDPRTGKRLEYCAMYDAGYTSLGGVGDTLRNPKLRYVDEQGNERYRPAYEMTEDVEERAGRD